MADPGPARAPSDPLPEVELPTGTLLVGDLHLDVERAGPQLDGFCAWLEGLARVPRLVILGDLFEFWLGPAQERSEGARRVLSALAGRVAAGTAVELIPGNRDFLLGPSFERATGARVRSEGLVGLLEGGGRALVLHGDVLCTRDLGYQRLRRVLRSRPVRWLGPRLPAALSRRLAKRLRRASRTAVAAKAPPETAIQASACRELARRHGCGTVVCGHAHAFRDEALGEGLRLLVVDAFGGPRDTLEVGPAGRLGPRARA